MTLHIYNRSSCLILIDVKLPMHYQLACFIMIEVTLHVNNLPTCLIMSVVSISINKNASCLIMILRQGQASLLVYIRFLTLYIQITNSFYAKLHCPQCSFWCKSILLKFQISIRIEKKLRLILLGLGKLGNFHKK